MTLKITHKHGTTAGTPPAAGDIDVGEIAINAADAEIYTKDTSGNVRKFQNTTTGTAAGVQFTQAGTGAVQRTVGSKLQDVISVKDFGAVGNGTTDDTQAFKNAVATGRKIFVPVGIYRITSNIDTAANGDFSIDIQGETSPYQSHAWATSPSSSDFSYYSYDATKLDPSKYAIIKCDGCPFIGEHDTASTIGASHEKLSKLSNLLFIADNNAQMAVYIKPFDCCIEDCTFVGFDYFGLFIRSGITSTFKRLAFYDCGWNLAASGTVSQLTNVYYSGCAIKVLGGDTPQAYGTTTLNKQATTLNFSDIYISVRQYTTANQSGYRAIQVNYAYGISFTNIGSYTGSFFYNAAATLQNYYGENYSANGSAAGNTADTHALYFNQSSAQVSDGFVANFSSSNQAIGVLRNHNTWARHSVISKAGRELNLTDTVIRSGFKAPDIALNSYQGTTFDYEDTNNYQVQSSFTGDMWVRISNRNLRSEYTYAKLLVNFSKLSNGTYDSTSQVIAAYNSVANALYRVTVNSASVNSTSSININLTVGSSAGSTWNVEYGLVGLLLEN